MLLLVLGRPPTRAMDRGISKTSNFIVGRFYSKSKVIVPVLQITTM